MFVTIHTHWNEEVQRTERMTIEAAAEALGIDVYEIEYSLDEFGRCDAETPEGLSVTVVEDGAEFPGVYMEAVED